MRRKEAMLFDAAFSILPLIERLFTCPQWSLINIAQSLRLDLKQILKS
jgi:hypothetical protein